MPPSSWDTEGWYRRGYRPKVDIVEGGGSWSEDFLYKIPVGISNAEAASLMCAGSVIFSSLREFNVAPTECVAVIGVGVLGRLAIQSAANMGF
ncbi:hypothetical protein BBP40_000582 [Aspergillus hancockii]|nr:hypothetical protein BBP40_000582 [Aspergillus hancockii]